MAPGSWNGSLGRRRFLQLAASALLLGRAARAGGKAPLRIAVVGAGMAGLAAARRLADLKHSVVVFEARDRIGGRIWTDRSWPGLALDRGAQWIQGKQGNPLVKLAREARARTLDWDEDVEMLWDAQGRRLSKDEVEALQARLESLAEALEDLDVPAGANWSLSRAIQQATRSWDLSPDQKQALEYAVHSTIEIEYAASTGQLAFPYDELEADQAGGSALFPEGCDGILRNLAEGLEIRLNQPVQRIELAGRSQVRVETGTGAWSGDAVIVSLPLGVLKTGAVKFTPALPERKLQAIRKLGMGVLNKLYLRFPGFFWPRDVNHFRQIPPVAGQWSEWMNIGSYSGKPVLLAFNAAAFAAGLEALPEREVVAQAMASLRGLFGTGIPEPEAAIRTRWAADPHAGGSYSFEAVGSSGEDRKALAEPIEGRIFFAGEAVDLKFPASVQGAYRSGEAVVRQILG